MPRPAPRLMRVLFRRLAWLACAASCACGEDVIQLGKAELPTSPLAVEQIVLRQASTTELVSDLEGEAAVSLAGLSSTGVSLTAVVSGSVGSVEFIVDGDVSVEHVSPFTYPGDTDGKLQAFTAELGQHGVTATPYSEVGAQGQRGTSLKRAFTFVN